MEKTDVRELARKYGLRVAEKPDSQEICFVPNNDYAAVIDARAPGASAPGPVVDATGRRLGSHDGIHRFTIGQRKGLGIAAPAPLYVVRLDASTRTVVVGSKKDLERSGFDSVGSELDCRRRAAGTRSRLRADPLPSSRLAGDDRTGGRRDGRTSPSTSRSPPSRPARPPCSMTGRKCWGEGGSTDAET